MFLVVIPLLLRVVCSFLFSNIASTFPLHFDITQPRIIVSLKDILLLYIFASLHFIYAKRKCYVEFSSLVVSHACALTPHMLLKIFTYNVSLYNSSNVFALCVCEICLRLLNSRVCLASRAIWTDAFNAWHFIIELHVTRKIEHIFAIKSIYSHFSSHWMSTFRQRYAYDTHIHSKNQTTSKCSVKHVFVSLHSTLI